MSHPPLSVPASIRVSGSKPIGATGRTAIGLSPLAELRAHFCDFAAYCRATRLYGALIRVEAEQDIAVEAAVVVSTKDRLAYTAEQADTEADKIMSGVLADGKVTKAEVPLLQRALRHIRRSAAADHKITEIVL